MIMSHPNHHPHLDLSSSLMTNFNHEFLPLYWDQLWILPSLCELSLHLYLRLVINEGSSPSTLFMIKQWVLLVHIYELRSSGALHRLDLLSHDLQQCVRSDNHLSSICATSLCLLCPKSSRGRSLIFFCMEQNSSYFSIWFGAMSLDRVILFFNWALSSWSLVSYLGMGRSPLVWIIRLKRTIVRSYCLKKIFLNCSM